METRIRRGLSDLASNCVLHIIPTSSDIIDCLSLEVVKGNRKDSAQKMDI